MGRLWATPNAHDGRRPGADLKSTQGGNLNRDAVMWMTPTTQSAKGGVDYQRVKGKNVLILDGQAKALMEQWPTPASRDYRTPNSQESQESRKHTGGEQLPNFVEHHFSHPVLSTLDGRPSCKPPHGSPLQLPIHLNQTSAASTHGSPNGSWAGQSVGRRT